MHKEQYLSSRKNYLELGLTEDHFTGEEQCLVSRIYGKLIKLKADAQSGFLKAYEMGRSEPRKVVFAAKMALALVIVSLLIFFQEPLSYIGEECIWAILTVVVVFEYSIGIV